MEDYRRRVEAARDQLDARELATAVAQGRAMGFEQAVAYALQEGEAEEPPLDDSPRRRAQDVSGVPRTSE